MQDHGKMLVRPAGGVIAWHVHQGLLERRHAQYAALGSCAVVVHAANLIHGRFGSERFVRPGVDWGQWRPAAAAAGASGGAAGAGAGAAYVERCFSPGTPPEVLALFNRTWRTT